MRQLRTALYHAHPVRSTICSFFADYLDRLRKEASGTNRIEESNSSEADN
jgi:hypothetical protein